ncbi:MAG: hypothetical protein NW223_14400 [Hyphomicrobiaceae bacterium]|nr:hypothetical protein [Hyphomicrobiaceae bacterium]
MPYYFGEGDPGWDDLDDGALKAADFRYLTPPDLGCGPDPVHFSVDARPPAAPPPPGAPPPTSFWDRLLGRRRIPPLEGWAQRQARERQRNAYSVALVTQAMRQAGIARAYCRYDGGNDEGFAWLDHFVTTAGERRTAEDLADDLLQTDLVDKLIAADAVFQHTGSKRRDHLIGAITDGLATECAVQLLGYSYGTGPYYLYGAFVVDFAACTITDDPKAEPVVENISLKA